MSAVNAKLKKRLGQFHEEMVRSEQRLQMAIQTLQGAQQDVQAKRMRFESAVEFVGGTGATWTHSPEDGVVVTEAGAAPPPEAKQIQNGAGLPTPAHVMARATRRQIKREFEK